MIDSRTHLGEHVAPPRGPGRRGSWRVAASFVGVLLLTAAALLVLIARGARPEHEAAARPPAPVAAAPSAAPSAPAVSASPSASPTATALPRGLLRLPGVAPTHGTGRFAYAAGRGPVLGKKGPLRRFRVAVEQGSRENVAQFAAETQAILGDPRSWIGGGRLRLQKVGGSDAAEFTVYLATRDTAGRMCASGGVGISLRGRPYTSCRSKGKAIINLDRWRSSAPPYVSAKIPLIGYRQYVINHEVGHELGHSHEGCPRKGSPAPVMVQQTLTLRGCRPYAWPRRGNRELSGPRV
jgi:uncharacterized protein DUF3152